MSRLRALVVKEVRGLLKERLVLVGMIIMPALIMALLGGLQGAAIHRAVNQAKGMTESVVVAVAPNASESDKALANLVAKSLNATLVESPNANPEELLRQGYKAVILVEPGAWRNLSRGLQASIRVYASVPGPSPIAASTAQALGDVVADVARALVAEQCKAVLPNASASFLSKPLRAETVIVVWGREVPGERYSSYLMGLYAFPIALLILLTSAVQVGAISIGMEREAKTLEMLLASPVTPGEVVAAKILGVLAVALAGAASFGAGFAIYYHSVTSSVGAQQGLGVHVEVSPGTAAILAVTLALDLYIAGLLGLILGLGAQDVRGAQLVANYFAFLLLIPYFAVFMGLVPTPDSPEGLALLADPLYPPLLASVAAAFGRTSLAVASLAVQLIHLAVWTLVAVKLLTPERLIVGLPIRRLLRRREAMRPV